MAEILLWLGIGLLIAGVALVAAIWHDRIQEAKNRELSDGE